MNEKNTVELLFIIKKVFNELGIRFWLSDGTLLGAVRDKKFIPWDGDIDLGMYYEDIKEPEIRRKLTKKLEEYGCTTVFLMYNRSVVIRKEGAKPTDIRFYGYVEHNMEHVGYRKKNSLGKALLTVYKTLLIEYYGSFSAKLSKKIKFIKFFYSILPLKLRAVLAKMFLKTAFGTHSILKATSSYNNMNFIFELDEIEFYSEKFMIPKNYKGYLEDMYGKDWEIPNKDFVYNTTIEEIS